MTVVDKTGVLARLGSTPVSIELGCGPAKVDPTAIGLDLIDLPGVDLVGDVFEALAQFPVGSVSKVYSAHFFEHVGDVPRLLEAIARVLAPNGVMETVVPHFSNPYFYSDYTHRAFFGLYTFSYFSEETIFARKVPKYGQLCRFKLIKVDLVFKSSKPFWVRHIMKRVLGTIFNATAFLQEFYEENFAYWFPCYEIRYVVQRNEVA